eukprot:1763760-Rhodomonas_salina.1
MAFCSLFELRLSVAALEGADLASGGEATISVTGPDLAGTLTFSFTYEAAGLPSLELLQPQAVTVRETGGAVVQLLLSNFPSSGCGLVSCAAEAKNVSIEVDGVAATVQAVQDSNGLLEILFVPPLLSTATSKSSVLSALDSSSTPIYVNFHLKYVSPSPVIEPVDGPQTGGIEITVTAVGWGDMSASLTAGDLVVTFADQQAVVTDVVG